VHAGLKCVSCLPCYCLYVTGVQHHESRRFILFSACVTMCKWHWYLFLPCDASIKRSLSVMLCLCVSVCLSCVKMNKHIFKIVSPLGRPTILVFPYQTAWQYSDGNPPNGGVECRWGRQKSQFWANIWHHCVLWTVPAASAIHSAVTDHGEFITLVAGKRRSLLMARNNGEVYDKKPQRYAKDIFTQW